MKRLMTALVHWMLLPGTLLLPGSAHCGEHEADPLRQRIIVVAPGETVNEDFFAAGETIEISGTVNGDAYLAAARIIIDGTVNGNLIAAGGTIKIAGSVTENARIAGGQISVSGTIGRNLTAGGGSIELFRNASVKGGIAAAGGSVHLSGPVSSYAKIAAGSLVVGGRINGGLDAAVGEVRLTSDASINGDFTYWSSRPATFDERALIAGSINHLRPSKSFPASDHKAVRFFSLLGIALEILGIASTLLIGLLFINLFPDFSRASVKKLRNRPWFSLGTGLLILVAVPGLSLLLVVSLVGIPLALIVLALFLISMYLSKIIFIYWAGLRILGKGGRTAGKNLSFLVGTAVYLIASALPLVGGVLAAGIALCGLGAAILVQRERLQTAGQTSLF